MKLIILLVFVFISLTVKGTNYYFSATGNDIFGTGAIGSPYQSITKLNAIWLAGTLAPGDSILFKRGDEFYGRILVSESGGSSTPIVISGYGAGAKPVITGFVTLNSWTNIGSGKYEIVNSAFLTTCNVVTIDGKSYAMGRTPNGNGTNKGYLNFEFHLNNTSITDNQLTGNPNWTGADVVIRTNRYIIERKAISTHSNSTVEYTPGTVYTPSNGFGYFFENSLLTLDQLGEWYYNPGLQKLTMYFGGGSPASYTIRVTTIDTLFEMHNFDNVVLNGLSFQGANKRALDFYSVETGTSKVINCDIKYCGENAIFCGTSANIIIDGNLIEDADSHGIYLSATGNYTVTNNTLRRIGILPGHAGTINENTGIRASCDNTLIQYNIIDSVGYAGIRYAGNNDNIRNNFIQHYCMIVDDAGGIYTGNGAGGTNSGNQIVNNVIINGASALEGTTANTGATSGIYLDDNTNGVTVTGNSVANNNLNGIFLHNTYNATITNNVLFNAGTQQLLFVHNSPQSNFSGMTVTGNVLFSKTLAGYTMQAKTDVSNVNTWGTVDFNYHARPLAQTTIIREVRPGFIMDLNIPDWFEDAGLDQHSIISPKVYAGTINADDSIRFEYNATNAPATKLLPGTYVDVFGGTHTNSITLAAYSSAVLMSTSYVSGSPTGAPPTISITGPTNGDTYVAAATIPLTVNAADDTGVSDVKWYSNAVLIATVNTAPYSFIWSGVPAGSYSITGVVTDIEGVSTTSSAVSITVTSPTSTGTVIPLRLNKILIVQ